MTTLWNPQFPSLRLAIVCYADILGFGADTQQAFASGTGNDFLQRIKHSLNKAYAIVRRFNSTYPGLPPLFEMKVFTDNIVVAYPLDDLLRDEGEPELGTIMLLFAQVQASLACDGFFLRGAISFGQHYQDDDVVYGDALLEAVGLDHSGGAPRLVIAPSVEDLVAVQLSAYGNGDGAPHFVELLEDPVDDSLFLNYLGSELGHFPDFPIHRKLLPLHRDRVVLGLQQHNSNSRVRSKYRWLARYHNYVCHAFVADFPVSASPYADPEYQAYAQEAQMALNFVAPDIPGYQPRLLDPVRLGQRVSSRLGTG